MKVAGSDKRRNLILIYCTSGWRSDDQEITRKLKKKEKKENIWTSFWWKSWRSGWISKSSFSNWRQTHSGHTKGLHLSSLSTQLEELIWLSATINSVTHHSANVSASSEHSGHTVVLSVGYVCTGSPTLSVSRASTCGTSSEGLAPTGQTYFWVSAAPKAVFSRIIKIK